MVWGGKGLAEGGVSRLEFVAMMCVCVCVYVCVCAGGGGGGGGGG